MCREFGGVPLGRAGGRSRLGHTTKASARPGRAPEQGGHLTRRWMEACSPGRGGGAERGSPAGAHP